MARQGMKVVAATCNCGCIECRNEHHDDCPLYCRIYDREVDYWQNTYRGEH